MNHYGIDGDVVVRLVGAMMFGAAVGLERELGGHTAGIRTHIAVCVGAALFGVISTLGFSEFQNIPTNTFRADITRVASQVVVGVGFLGGGMIMRRNGGISNLTTAASVWTVAAIGLAAGVGDLGTAAVATVVTVVYLLALLPVRRWVEHTAARGKQTLAMTLAPGVLPEEVIGRLDGQGTGVAVRLDHVEKENGRIVAVVSITGRPEAAVTAATARVAALAEVTDLVPRQLDRSAVGGREGDGEGGQEDDHGQHEGEELSDRIRHALHTFVYGSAAARPYRRVRMSAGSPHLAVIDDASGEIVVN